MKEFSSTAMRHSMFDNNLEEYVRSELHKSMISTTGIPKSFIRPGSALPSAQEDENMHHQPSEILKLALGKPQKPKIGRSNSMIIKVSNMLLHKHQKMLEKITVPCDKVYYEKIPVKPGFLFYDSLIKTPRGNLKELKINIPESIYYTDKIYFLHTLENGEVEVTNNIFGYKFMKIVEKNRSQEEKSIYDKIAAIMRGHSDELNNMHKLVLDWNQFKVKMIGNEFSPYSLTQRYIHTPGHRPAVTRLHYFSHQKRNVANFAYFINNIEFEYPDTLNNLQKCIVNTQDAKNIEFFKKHGSSIKYYEAEASKIIKYLNKGYNIRIDEIILDFLTDSTGKIWLCGCKSIKVDESTLTCSLDPLQDWWPGYEKPKEKKKIENQYLMNFVHCKLCRLYYTNNQLSHLVSVRMLMLFKVHSLRRVKLPLDTSHLKVTSADMLSQSVRICQYCYMLVTTEFELIQVEESLAAALNIPKKDLTYEDDPKLDVQKHFLPKKLVQWRLLVFLSKLYEFKLPEHCSNLYIQIKFGEIISAYKFHAKKTVENNEQVIVMDLIKLHYMFTSEGKTLEKLIKSDIMEIRLTIGDKFNERVLGGSKTQCLIGLPNTLELHNALYTKKQIYLFNSNDTIIGNLSVFLGLSCDKITETSKIKVALNKHHEVYIPEFYFMTIDPLPVEWLELLGEEPAKDESFGHRIEDSEFYKPTMAKSEMLRMEDITSPYKAIPKIYSEKKDGAIGKNTTSVTSLAVYRVVNNYLKNKKPTHSKTSSWSACTRKSRKTADTSRDTPNMLAKYKANELSEYF
ncbi:hypothetical protein SteCoe_9928 [Stentor coeruleus]|uniref:Uncharacterized protein n=1 Tax=Stentor coeruleus TaxID=5963 RepID=A0A1R2CGR6_9CILI|nr:hypothetical protein SteCoe_9928 [Stentor coeruleus]